MSPLITTDPGSATDSSRAAMCGVSPTMSCCGARLAGAHLPDDHDPGVEADRATWSEMSSRSRKCSSTGHELVEDPKARVHGPLGVVLMGARVAEVGDDAVTEVLAV